MLKTLLTILLFSVSLLAFGSNGLLDKASDNFLDPPKISIYPNPTSDYFGVSDHSGISTLRVFNLVGKEMRSFEVRDGDKYNISDLPNGMYLVQLLNENKKIMNTQRLQKR